MGSSLVNPSGAAGPSDLRVRTIGHGDLPAATFAGVLADAGIDCIIDVRAHPGSRRNPHFGHDEFAVWLPRHGIAYRWVPELGGRRRPVPGSRHVELRNDSFRAYADHMESDEFGAGVEDLLDAARDARVVAMCSESVWWRCHRRLLADHLVLARGVGVDHVFHDGRQQAHPPTAGVRVDGASVVYDLPTTGPQ